MNATFALNFLKCFTLQNKIVSNAYLYIKIMLTDAQTF